MKELKDNGNKSVVAAAAAVVNTPRCGTQKAAKSNHQTGFPRSKVVEDKYVKMDAYTVDKF